MSNEFIDNKERKEMWCDHITQVFDAIMLYMGNTSESRAYFKLNNSALSRNVKLWLFSCSLHDPLYLTEQQATFNTLVFMCFSMLVSRFRWYLRLKNRLLWVENVLYSNTYVSIGLIDKLESFAALILRSHSNHVNLLLTIFIRVCLLLIVSMSLWVYVEWPVQKLMNLVVCRRDNKIKMWLNDIIISVPQADKRS